jgi:copper(I)-binding protein
MRIIAATCLALSLFAAPALARDYTAGPLKIQNPWTREMPPGSKVGGGFMIITNTGDEADTLVTLKTSRADHGEVHEMSMDGGVMKMRQLEGGLEIPPGATVELKPGSYHVMFIDVTDGFREGEAIDSVLVFEKAGEVPVEFTVGPVGTKMAPGQMHDGEMKHDEMKKSD